MRILYQPVASASPGDWLTVDSADWSKLGAMNINAVNCQGVVFTGPDHYSVEDVSPGVTRVVAWCDDTAQWPVGNRWARVITFRNLAVDADAKFGGAINTNQSQVIYAEAKIKPVFDASFAGHPKVTVLKWKDFDPNRIAPLDGLMLSDELFYEHVGKLSETNWREWTEGVDPSELDANGLLKDQRAQGRYQIPVGTRTYYHIAVARASGVHASLFESELALATATEFGYLVTGMVSTGYLTHLATTPSGEPNSAAWPTTGVYRHQLDCYEIGADITFGLLTQGAGAGHFGRVNSALTSELQAIQQDESAFAGTGLHVASLTDPAWSTGNASDRFEINVAAINTVAHPAQDFGLAIGLSDDYADGPWAAAPVTDENDTVFFGANC